VVGLIVTTKLAFFLAAVRMVNVGQNLLRGQAGFSEVLEMIGVGDLRLLVGIGILIMAILYL
jgi:hypothetical protein